MRKRINGTIILIVVLSLVLVMLSSMSSGFLSKDLVPIFPSAKIPLI